MNIEKHVVNKINIELLISTLKDTLQRKPKISLTVEEFKNLINNELEFQNFLCLL